MLQFQHGPERRRRRAPQPRHQHHKQLQNPAPAAGSAPWQAGEHLAAALTTAAYVAAVAATALVRADAPQTPGHAHSAHQPHQPQLQLASKLQQAAQGQQAELGELAANDTSAGPSLSSMAAATAQAASQAASGSSAATPRLASYAYELLPSSLQYGLYDFWEMFHNPELNKYALFNGGPWLVASLVGAYLYFVLRAGPRMMEKRQAFDLKPLIRLYNFGMVLFNAYLFIHASPFLNYGLHCWGCREAVQPMVRDSIPIVWLVLVSRFFDFFDTVFFVLRKKFSHVSFLHVFHHTVVPIGFWIGIKFAFFPVCCFVPYLNLVVHVIMYSYYGLSTFGPAVQKYLWWKKYLTRLQILQFLIALVHSLQPLYLRTCTFPAIFVMGQTAGAVLFLWLFISFYIKAYTMQRASTSQPPRSADLVVPEKHQLRAQLAAPQADKKRQ